MNELLNSVRHSLILLLGGSCVLAFAQSTPPAPARAPGAASDPRLAAFEERLLKLERANQKLIEENQRLREQFEGLARPKGNAPSAAASSGADTSDEGGAGARDNPAESSSGAAGRGRTLDDLDAAISSGSDTSDEGGAGARDNPAESPPGAARKGRTFPLRGVFGPGFELETENEEFQLQFHNEIQVEYRLFDKTGQGTVHNGFFVPRAITGVAGRITRPVEYQLSFQRGLSGVELRDAFVNFKYDDRLMLKAGRYRVPLTYEFYAISNTDLLQPERSLYTINFGGNRELGAMLWGSLFRKRLDYSVGLFNGQRNRFEDTNDDKDLVAYFNARPFQESERLAALSHLNVGSSLDFGNQEQELNPQALRTAVNASQAAGSSSAAPAFLIFNDNVIENGYRTLWGLHAAWYYKQLSLLAEWNDGSVTYATSKDPITRVAVPVDGYYVSMGYFLTGETVTRRTEVEVLKPFNLNPSKFGLGAWELQGRFSSLRLGSSIFTGGLADPNLWTNNVFTTDIGLNWYLNSYVKIYFDWQHAEFGSPVTFGRGRFIKTSELFWLRLQLYF